MSTLHDEIKGLAAQYREESKTGEILTRDAMEGLMREPGVYEIRHGDAALRLDLGSLERVEIFGAEYYSIDPQALSPEARQYIAKILSRLACGKIEFQIAAPCQSKEDHE